MSKTKYLAILAIAVMVISVASVVGPAPPDMPPIDGVKRPVMQYSPPPIIDGVVQVDVSWPAASFMGYMQVRDPPDNIDVAKVYMLFDEITGYTKVDNSPAGYGPEDEQGYFLYIGIKTLPGFRIPPGDDAGAWIRIDWDQDGYVDLKDNNGNSANHGYSTEFARTCGGVEWKIPYIDEFNGVCKSPLDIIVHVNVIFPDDPCGSDAQTSTFPGDRPDGPFQSTTLCVGDKISPEPPEPGDWGIRTIGFWKHQFNTAAGFKKGHQHVDTDSLKSYVAYISAYSDIPELQNLDPEDFASALQILELRGKQPMYRRGVQQLFAVWLNYVSGNEEWDSDGDGTPDEDLIDVIAWAEDLLLDGDPSNDKEVKNYCDKLNNSGDE
jgi:hypothetical protein